MTFGGETVETEKSKIQGSFLTGESNQTSMQMEIAKN